MTSQELAQYLRSKAPDFKGDDQTLVTTWLQSHPDFKVDNPPSQPIPSQLSQSQVQPSQQEGFKPIPFAFRLIPPVLGGAVGSLGGPVGTAIGGAAGAGIGESIAEYLEGSKQSPGRIAASSIIGAIPFGKTAEGASLGAKVLQSGLKGAAIGGASDIIQKEVGENTDPTLGSLAKAAGGGAVLGGGTEAILGKLLAQFKKEVPQALEGAAPKAGTNEPNLGTEAPPQIPTDKGLKFVKPAQTITPARPRTPEELQSFKSIKYMPEDVRDDFTTLLEKSDVQRRGVQPLARTEALATNQVVPLSLAKPGKTMNAEEAVAHQEAWTSVGREVNTLAEKIAKGDATSADKIMFQQKWNDQRTIGLNYVGSVTEAARLLRNTQRMQRAFDVADSEFLDHLSQSPKFKDNVEAMAKAVTEAKGDPQKMLDLALANRKLGPSDIFQAYLYNNILSGTKTPMRKTIADVMNGMANVASFPFALGADITRSAVKGTPRTIFAGEFAPQIYGMLHAVPEAVKDLTFVLGHGYSLKAVDRFAEEGIDSIDKMPKELPGGYLSNFPLRNLKAVTSFFHEIDRGQELYGGAYAKARQAGLTEPKEIRDFMNNLLTGKGEESEQLFKQADTFAKKATFMDPSGPVLNAFLTIKNEAPEPVKSLLTFIAPIVRLPGKVLQRGLETSPIGFMMKAAKQGDRAGAQALGRATMGTLALAPFMMMAAQGRLSGSGPKDPGARAELLEKGWIPNAIKGPDGKWVEYHLAQPFATEMSIAANAFEAFNETKKGDSDAEDIWSKAGEAFARSANSILDQSYFASLSSFQRALSDPTQFGGALMRGFAQDMVPYSGLLRNVTAANDPTVRKPQTIGQGVESIIPGMSQDVPARLTRFGDDVQRPGGALQRGMNPITISQQKPEGADPVADLLEAYGVRPQVPRGTIKRKGVDLKMTPEQKQIIEEAIGKERRELLNPLTQRNTSDKMIEKRLREATEEVDNLAAAKLRKGKPFKVEDIAPLYRRSLKKGDVDKLYQAYRDSLKQGQ